MPKYIYKVNPGGKKLTRADLVELEELLGQAYRIAKGRATEIKTYAGKTGYELSFLGKLIKRGGEKRA